MAKVSKKVNEAEQKTSRKKQLTVRQRTQTSATSKNRRVRNTAGKVTGRIKNVREIGKKEYHPIRFSDSRLGRVLNKRVRLFPKFIRDSWNEIRKVTWPTARETTRLTLAVFIFSVIFAAIVGVIDYGLDKLFREVVIGK